MTFHVIIPARMASMRLPNKPLADIGGAPMIVRVAQQAAQSGAASVTVAGDDASIIAAAKAAGFNALMTDLHHTSGTERIYQAASILGLSDDAIVVNVQGDEPLIPPQLIALVAEKLQQNKNAVMATACHALHAFADMLNPNVVKVVLDADSLALYFSRAPIPYPRDTLMQHDVDAFPSGLPAYRHIGIYAYRASFLKIYADLSPAPLEKFESLEQLRVLWHGYKIAVSVVANAPPAGVDTAEDLARVQKVFAK
ncbi:MAG: 3-deoxy-manno-octulosonate cytidylyltransferase [Pseudomonadota bacterium]|jgi:3-deoxy-manno-octulosonate cytidylyltransferase (CMP-KDO synthetase)